MEQEEVARFHETADSIEATNRYLRRAIVGAVAALLALAVAVITWGAISFQSAVHRLEEQQQHFHADSTCQTAALDRILVELADAQQAELHGQPVPRFIYPKPC